MMKVKGSSQQGDLTVLCIQNEYFLMLRFSDISLYFYILQVKKNHGNFIYLKNKHVYAGLFHYPRKHCGPLVNKNIPYNIDFNVSN